MAFEAEDVLYRHRSAHQLIEVCQSGKRRLLRCADGAIQSAIALDRPEQLLLAHSQAMMASLLFHSQPRHVLLLGLGGADMLRYLHHHLPQTQLDAVEIDAEMVRLCHEYFALPVADNIAIHVADAGKFMQYEQRLFDLLLVDIYQGEGVPPLLLAQEFYRHCHARLTEDGVLALNLLTDDAATFTTILSLLRTQFQRNTLCLAITQHMNILIFAFKTRPQRLNQAGLLTTAAKLEQKFRLDFTGFVGNLFSTNPTVGGELIFEK